MPIKAPWIAAGFGHEKHAAREAKNAFGLIIDTARAGPALIEKHGRGVVVVIAVEEYKRLIGKPTTDRRAAPSGTK